MNQIDVKKLEMLSTKIRIGILDAVFFAQSGHPGGSLSCADILTALYFHAMKVEPANPSWADRDRFVLSKGHCSPALYSTLAERGFFPKEELKNFRHIDSFLQGHPDMKKVPGVDMSTGSLGQGLSASVGMALAGKLDKKDYRVYTLLGDGEIEEGQVWEAAMSASHYKLDNITAFLDYNGLQIDGPITKVMSPDPVDEKFHSFGWNVIKVDGHNFEQIIPAINEAKNIKGKPTIIICKTIKGKCISFMECVAGWHGKAPNEEQYKQAIAELESRLKELGGAI
ncbi:MAG: transketolase [Ignavibacteriales bacterium]